MSNFSIRQQTFYRLQLLGWAIFGGFQWTFYWGEYQKAGLAMILALSNVAFYIGIVYFYYFVLVPRLLSQKRLVDFLLVSLSIVGWSFAWVHGTSWLRSWFFENETAMGNLPWYIYFYQGIRVISLLAFSLLLRYAQGYFQLLSKSELIAMQQKEAELERLKLHVQPHFLFNTLNNIYYIAQQESPRSAEMISELSNMMRYFMDDSNKQLVPLRAELAFIDDYLKLENVRMRYPAKITKEIAAPLELQIPPMLLIPFIENVFKHGIMKSSQENALSIHLSADDQQLHYRVINTVLGTPKNNESGSGLKNLRSRLSLLFGNNFHLQTQPRDNEYIAQLTIPITRKTLAS